MHYLDILIPAVLLLAAIRGATRGFFVEVSGAAALGAGLLAAAMLTSAWLPAPTPGMSPAPEMVLFAFAGICIATYVGVLFVSTLLSRVWMRGWRGLIGRSAGAMVAVSKWAIVLTVSLLALQATATPGRVSIGKSQVASSLIDGVKAIVGRPAGIPEHPAET